MANAGLYDKAKDSIIHHTGSIRRIVEESDKTCKLFHDKLVESGFAFSPQILCSKKKYEYDDMIKQVLDSLEICKEDQDQLEECCQAFLTSLLELGEHQREAIQLSRELRQKWTYKSLRKETSKKEEWKLFKALDVKPMEQTSSHSFQPPLQKQHNPHNKFARAFDRSSNKIVEILVFKNPTMIMPFLDQLCDLWIITPCLKDQILRMENKLIQAKAIVSTLRKVLSRGVMPAFFLKKLIDVFKLHGNYFKDIVDSLEIEIPIKYRKFVSIRRSEQVPMNCINQASAMVEKVQPAKHQDLFATDDSLKKRLRAQYSNMESRSGLLINNEGSRNFFELVANNRSVKAKQSNVPLDLHSLAQREDSYPSRTLIFGDPGVGKSCIVTELCKGWYKGTHLQDYEYVILLRADNKRVRNVTSIDDFFPGGNKKLLDPIKEVDGENSLFIIDGYDEFSEELRKPNSFYDSFIRGDDDLALASMIVTARPWCAKQIKNYFPNEIEILGFTPQSKDEFIRFHLKGDANEFILQKPTETCPLTIPLLLTILIEIFKEAKSQQQRQKGNENHFPKTQTKIYGSLVRTLVLRYAREDPNLSKFMPYNIEIPPGEFSCFPRNIYLPFFEICTLAYQLLVCPTYSRSEPLLLKFKLLTESIDETTSGSHFCYKFLHSMIQEYLAAYCISRMEDRKRKQCIQVLKTNIRYSLVLEFLYGFGCYDEPKDKKELNYYSTVHNFAVFRQLCEVEVHQDAMIKSVYQGLTEPYCVVKRTFPRPSPGDFWCLGRVIALSGRDWKLGFTLRPITSNHLQMLHEGIKSVGELEKYGQIKKFGLSLTEIDETKLEQCNFFLNDRCSSHIEKLYLFENNFTSIIVPTLCHYLKNLRQLKKFLFHHNNISPGGHEDLIKALGDNCANLEHISLSNLHPHECELLVHSLRRLKIVEVWGISTAGCETLFQLLAPGTSIERFEIHESEVTYNSLSSLPKTLPTSHLETFKLENCRINCSCVATIALAVSRSSSLTLLDLSDNWIGNRGAELLLELDTRVHFGDTWRFNRIFSRDIRLKIQNRS